MNCNLFRCTQLLGGVIIFRTIRTVRNSKDGYHEQDSKADQPLVVLPFQRNKGNYKKEERQECLVISKVCSVWESCPPRPEGCMLYKRSEDKSTDKQE